MMSEVDKCVIDHANQKLEVDVYSQVKKATIDNLPIDYNSAPIPPKPM
jgi:hypothetical protein